MERLSGPIARAGSRRASDVSGPPHPEASATVRDVPRPLARSRPGVRWRLRLGWLLFSWLCWRLGLLRRHFGRGLRERAAGRWWWGLAEHGSLRLHERFGGLRPAPPLLAPAPEPERDGDQQAGAQDSVQDAALDLLHDRDQALDERR